MKIPPFFIGATVLFWGYEKNLFILGIVLSLLIESSRFTKTRWQLSEEDYIKISDLTSILLLAAIALIVMNYKARYLLLTVTGWLPLILMPLILAQAYGADDKIIIGTRLGSKTKGEQDGEKKHHMHRPMDFSFAYAAITFFAAASANSRHEAFFPLFLALTGWLLFANRGKAFSPLSFAAILLLGGLLGFSGIQGVEKGYAGLNRMMINMWKTHFQHMGADPFKTHTSFGDINRLKLSSKIVMRLYSDGQPPTLLKEAGYNVFFRSSWFNRDREFAVTPMSSEGHWRLDRDINGRSRNLQLSTSFTENKGLLPFPYGIKEIRDLDIVELTRNREGLLYFEEGNSLQNYGISYTPGRTAPSTPDEYHLLIPEQEKAVLQQIIKGLDLDSLPEKKRLRKIQDFFRNGFSYSLTTGGKGDYDTPVSNFLLQRKSGHCELFATATALLLRQADIPSRYITGYAVAEKSLFGQGYVIRNRHAHAWTEAYLQGKWLVIDTTPANWLEEEKSLASLFEPIRDFFSFIKHQINLFKARKARKYNLPLSITVILLTAFLIFRIYRRLNKEKQAQKSTEPRRAFPRQDSPFALIEGVLNSEGPKRRENEAFHEWLARIGARRRIDAAQLISLHRLHQKLRFDPHGIGEGDMAQLEAGVEHWLRKNSEMAE